MLGTLWLPPLSSILRLCVYLGAAARLRPTPLTAPSALSGTAIAMCFGSDREPGLYRTLSTRCTRWCAACGRPPPPRAARACGARHAAATGALTAPHVGRSLSGCARCSWRSPPPGRSCTAGLLWLSPRPCPRRLNPACTAAARVAARIAIMPCAHVCRRRVCRCSPRSRRCRGMWSHSRRLSISTRRGAHDGVRRVARLRRSEERALARRVSS